MPHAWDQTSINIESRTEQREILFVCLKIKYTKD